MSRKTPTTFKTVSQLLLCIVPGVPALTQALAGVTLELPDHISTLRGLLANPSAISHKGLPMQAVRAALSNTIGDQWTAINAAAALTAATPVVPPPVYDEKLSTQATIGQRSAHKPSDNLPFIQLPSNLNLSELAKAVKDGMDVNGAIGMQSPGVASKTPRSVT